MSANRIRVGFVGLGNQGGPMAAAIVAAGFPTTLWARRPASLEPYAGTAATVAASVAELARASDVVGVCVVDDAGVRELALGADGILANLPAGGVLAVHATVSAALCVELAGIAASRGVHVLDAPVSNAAAPRDEYVGSHNAAANAVAARALTCMVGGDADVVRRVRPVFEAFAGKVEHLGPVGAGQYAKLLNNALAYGNFAVAYRVLDVGRQLGLDPSALLSVLRASSSATYAMQLMASHADPFVPEAARRHQTEQFGALVQKDIGLLFDEARAHGVDLGSLGDLARDAQRAFGGDEGPARG